MVNSMGAAEGVTWLVLAYVVLIAAAAFVVHIIESLRK